MGPWSWFWALKTSMGPFYVGGFTIVVRVYIIKLTMTYLRGVRSLFGALFCFGGCMAGDNIGLCKLPQISLPRLPRRHLPNMPSKLLHRPG